MKINKHKKHPTLLTLTSIIGTSALYINISETHAAVVKGGSDITPMDTHSKEASGVAMTYTIYGNNQVASGSGVFVAPNIMLTVAHNYLDKDKANGTSFVRGSNSAISYVVMNSDSTKRGNNTSSGYDDIIPKNNIHYYNDKEFVTSYSGDLAAVVTEKPVEAMTNGEDHARTLGFAKQGDKITFMGYPNDFSSNRLSADVKSTLVNGKMYKISGTLSNLDEHTGSGTYNTSALGGFSGGPIFNEKGEVVGIHQHGTNTDFGDDSTQHGGGLFFTDKHRTWINKMISEHGIKGWFVNGNDKYYYDDNHKALVNTERDINGAKYRFDSNGRATLISGKESGEVVLRATSPKGEVLFERVIGRGDVGTGFSYDFKKDKETENYFSKVPNAKIVSINGEGINKKFSESWSKDYVSKIALGKTTINMIVDGSNLIIKTTRKETDDAPISLLSPLEKAKSVPNGEKNIGSTVSLTSSAGLGSGTLINDDTIVTVAHNFVHLNTKTNPITIDNNVNKSGDVHYATLPNGKRVSFSNDDIHFWNREGFINGFKNDLAVVKLRNKFTGETGAKLHNDVSKLKQGDTIHVFGYPKGKLNPIFNGKVESVENYGANIMGVGYQGSAPGMSGGGMYNAQGELIGVHQNGVEGFRAGGITFSKEQLDWIKSVINGNKIKPIYLKDEPRHNNKKDERPIKPKDDVKDVLVPSDMVYEADENHNVGYIEIYQHGTPSTYRVTTSYEWDEKENKYIPVESRELIKKGIGAVTKVGTKNKIVTEVIKADVEYVKDPERKKGEPNVNISGHDGSKTVVTTYYVKDFRKPDIEAVVLKPIIKESVKRIVKVAAKDDVKFIDIEPTIERIMDDTRALGDNLTIPGSRGSKRIITEYSVDPKTGNISEKTSEAVVKEAGKTIIKIGTRNLEKEEAERKVREQAEKERLAREKAAKARREKEEIERKAREQTEKERLARDEQIKREREEAERKARDEKERLAHEEAEKAKREREEAERKVREQAEKERLAREEAEKAKREKEEIERLENLKADAEKNAKTKEESDRITKEREQLEKERLEKEQLEKKAKAKAERERFIKEQLANERLEKEQLEKQAKAKAERERLKKEQLEKQTNAKVEGERLAKEQFEKERLEKEQLEKQAKTKSERERLEKDQLEQHAKVEREHLAKEQLEKEHLANEPLEKNAEEKEQLEQHTNRVADTTSKNKNNLSGTQPTSQETKINEKHNQKKLPNTGDTTIPIAASLIGLLAIPLRRQKKS